MVIAEETIFITLVNQAVILMGTGSLNGNIAARNGFGYYNAVGGNVTAITQ